MAVRRARREQGGGRVCIMGFSAGAHLCAAFSAAGLGQRFREAAGLRNGNQQLAQVLVYPCLDASGWADACAAGWWSDNYAACERLGRVLELAKYDLVNATPVADIIPAAATFLVHSTQDCICHPSEHGDL